MRKLLVVLFLLFAMRVEARTLWISTSGSDSNGCTDSATALSTTAKRTINNVLSNCALQPGDTVNLRAGNYPENIDSVNGNLPAGGTDWGSGALTFQAAAGETVRINPTSSGPAIRVGTPTAG